MKAIPLLLIVMFLNGCESRDRRRDAMPSQVGETQKTLMKLGLAEPKLDDLALELTEGYEHVRPFLQQDIPPEAFDVLLCDILRDFDKKRIAEGSKPGKWLNRAMIEQRGVGLLSVFKEREPPATVAIDYHSWKATELLISKPPVWDRIILAGEERGRMFKSEISVTATKQGISNLTISFMVIITRQTRQDLAELEYQDGEQLYQLRGYYSTIPELPETGRSSSWLRQYTPYKKEVMGTGVRNLALRILSHQKYCEGGFDLSQESKKHLLEIMDLIMVHYANITGKSVFRELLEKQPYQLIKERESW